MSYNRAVTVPASLPAVSIILPCFNAARTIERALDSVACQTFRDWHIICVDDRSQDDTVDIIESYRSKLEGRLDLIRLSANGGPARARNVALSVATTAWITVLDADDAWHSCRLETLLRETDRGDVDAICDNLMGFDDHRGQATTPLFDFLPPTLDIVNAIAPEYQGRYNLGYMKPMIRRGFVETHGLQYNESLRTGEDLILLISCLALGGKVKCINYNGYIYTTPVGQDSRKLSRSTYTTPRDADLAAALERFLDCFSSQLTLSDITAVRKRMSYLSEIGPLSDFRHARLSRDWVKALRIFVTNRDVRRRVWTLLRPRLSTDTRA